MAGSGDAPLCEVTPIGSVGPMACSVVAANLQAVLELPTRITPAAPPVHDAHLPARSQYDAARLLRALAAETPPGLLRVGVTALDLCLPVLTYVYGEARVGARVAVISTARLGLPPGGAPGETSLLYERIAKIALHEAAHGLGLRHCYMPGCLMVFSTGLETLDRLHLRFCPQCTCALAIGREALIGARR